MTRQQRAVYISEAQKSCQLRFQINYLYLNLDIVFQLLTLKAKSVLERLLSEEEKLIFQDTTAENVSLYIAAVMLTEYTETMCVNLFIVIVGVRLYTIIQSK